MQSALTADYEGNHEHQQEATRIIKGDNSGPNKKYNLFSNQGNYVFGDYITRNYTWIQDNQIKGKISQQSTITLQSRLSILLRFLSSSGDCKRIKNNVRLKSMLLRQCKTRSKIWSWIKYLLFILIPCTTNNPRKDPLWEITLGIKTHLNTHLIRPSSVNTRKDPLREIICYIIDVPFSLSISSKRKTWSTTLPRYCGNKEPESFWSHQVGV